MTITQFHPQIVCNFYFYNLQKFKKGIESFPQTGCKINMI